LEHRVQETALSEFRPTNISMASCGNCCEECACGLGHLARASVMLPQSRCKSECALLSNGHYHLSHTLHVLATTLSSGRWPVQITASTSSVVIEVFVAVLSSTRHILGQYPKTASFHIPSHLSIPCYIVLIMSYWHCRYTDHKQINERIALLLI
jgi:hypothetical protein